MVSAPPPVPFSRDFNPQTGLPVAVAPGLVRVTAPNSGPFTFTGTNTFIAGEGAPFVIDPGPDDATHVEALLGALKGRQPAAIVLTHTHRDHSGAVRALAAATDAPVWFSGPHRPSRPVGADELYPLRQSCDFDLMPDRALADGEIIATDGVELEIVATPGHCANHVALGLVGSDLLISGDHVMGWNSTLIPDPDGSLADYFNSLDRLINGRWARYAPAHGDLVNEGPALARALKAHRQFRNLQIREVLAKGPADIAGLRAAMYPDLAPNLHGAADLTLSGHMRYLLDSGVVHAMPVAQSFLFALN